MKSSSHKIGLVVEGKTDKKFFDNYFKKQFGFIRNMVVLTSGTGDTCKIMNERAIKNKLEDLRDKNCTEIYILIDLDSKCKKDIYHCIVELRDDYIAKLNLKNEKDLTVIVVSSEIEAWMLSAWKKSDKKQKEDLKREFGIKSSKNIEEVLLQRFIKLQQEINPKNNESLKYFFCKLALLEEAECK